MKRFDDRELLGIEQFFDLYQRLNPKSINIPAAKVATVMIDEYEIYRELYACGLTNDQCVKHINNV